VSETPERELPTMSIDDAPLRVRRDYYRRERRNSALAIAVIMVIMLLLALGVWALLGRS
jgi:hypothetical protein